MVAFEDHNAFGQMYCEIITQGENGMQHCGIAADILNEWKGKKMIELRSIVFLYPEKSLSVCQ